MLRRRMRSDQTEEGKKNCGRFRRITRGSEENPERLGRGGQAIKKIWKKEIGRLEEHERKDNEKRLSWDRSIGSTRKRRDK